MPIVSVSRRHFNPVTGGGGWGISGWGTGPWGDPLTGGSAPSAPTGAFTVGTQVGVPAGTSLTATSTAPDPDAPDATESLLLTHPITGQTATRTVKTWRHRQWSSVLTPYPRVGETWFFDECKFGANNDPWVFGIGETNGRADEMDPLFVFRRCEFNGNGTTDIGVGGSFVWLLNSHITGTVDGWQGGAYSVGSGSNIVGYGPNIEQHADGFQCSGDGHFSLYQCWISISGVGQSSAFRSATEFGSLSGLNVHYCGIDGGGWAFDIGNSSTTTVSNVSIIGNRWTRAAAYGPAGVCPVLGTYTWTDNTFIDGVTIPSPM